MDASPLEAVAAVVASETGDGFYRALVRSLASTLGVEYAFVSEFTADRSAFRTLAVWGRGQFLEGFTLPLPGTPCEAVLAGEAKHYASGVCALFPNDTGLVTWHAEGYCGVPIVEANGTVVGHLVVIHDRPIVDGARLLSMLRILAMRVRAELERQKAQNALEAAERHYRDLYERAPVAYITIGTDGTIQNLNDQNLRVFGYTREQSIGHGFLEFLPSHAHGAATELFQRALGGEDIDEAEVEATRADGTTFWMRLTARVLRGRDDAIEGFRVTFVDVTDRKRAEERLRESEMRFRDLYDEAPVAYLSCDRSGAILRANQRAAELLGRPATELVGRSVDDFMPPTSALGWSVLVERLESGGRIEGDEAPFVNTDGTTRWVRFSVRPIRDADGRIIEIRSAGVDITEAKKAEEAVRLSEYLQEEIKSVHNFEEIVGRSPALGEALRKVELVATTESSVLILGETGTGKELFARAIHSRSPRRDRPLIKVNCAALPTGLIESELFGHERGAFTGAAGRRIGRFELASGGTLFLDEIGELPLELQAKLLRVLQDQEFERVGGSVTLEVDVRVIAATNRDLLTAVAQNTFRQDLFYRLNVFPIRVPALRERREDVPLLVHYFVNRYATKAGRRIESVPRRTMERLTSYAWPGNVRELENVIERAVILSEGPELEVPLDVVPADPAAPRGRSAASAPGQALDEVERGHILSVLQSSGWRIEGPRGAAKRLNLSPSSLRRRIQKLGLKSPDA